MNNSFLIDSHCHLQDDMYEDYKIEEILENAKNNNVKYVIVSGYDSNSNKQAVALAKRYNNIFATVGYHPSEADKEVDLEILKDYLAHPKVIALGEIGLDYHYDGIIKDNQKQLFIKQLKLANELQQPIVIHSRDSIEDTYNILKDYKNENIKGVLHCYASNFDMAEKFMKLNLLFSVSGVVTFKNNRATTEFVKKCPLDYLLVETDAPYLTPEPNRGKINFPGNVLDTAKKIAELKNVELEKVFKTTTNNVISLFDLKI